MTTDAPGDDASANASLTDCLHRRIARQGPVSVREYMALCLTDPTHGYYRRRNAIGSTGDFVTAPEVSQVFGELLGIWTATVWQQLGSPGRWRLVELGPGRGTLMRDLLRALKVLPECLPGLAVELIEISEPLMAEQRALLGSAADVVWHSELAPAPLPTIVIANEFLDALPVRQLVRAGGQWHERLVGVDPGGGFRFVTGDPRPLTRAPAAPAEGAIFETRDGFIGLIDVLAVQARTAPLACLFVDYGHIGPLTGETLQAVRDQRYAPVLEAPGEADLSAHVDFGDLTAAARAHGLSAHGPITQAELLMGLGLTARIERLMTGASPAVVNRLETAAARLVAPEAMGARYLATAITSPGLAPPPFATGA